MSFRKDQIFSVTITAAVFFAIYVGLFGLPSLPDSFTFPEFKKTESPTRKKKKSKPKSTPKVIDNLNGVKVYLNGRVSNVHGRNVTPDGYNLGLKYQCVEFIKRYYYEYYNHKMPDSYGHAKDFFDRNIRDGLMNRARNLRQFTNGSISRPRIGDILVFGPTPTNRFGHIGIISKSDGSQIQMIHQNPGLGNPSRVSYNLTQKNGKWYIATDYVLGWLRRS